MSRRSLGYILLLALLLAVCAGLGVVLPTKQSLEGYHAVNNPPPKNDSGMLPLDQRQREFIWQVEHCGLILSRHGFRSLADALSRADAQACRALLANDFTGQTFQQPREVRRAAECLEVVRQQDAGQPRQALDRDRFVAHLLDYRRRFSKPPKVALALMTLGPVARANLDGPWQGTCQLRMWGEMGVGQPGEVVLHLQYQVPLPSEEVLRRGGWLRSCTISQSQVAHGQHFLMREVAAERGIDVGRFHDNWRDPHKLTNTGGVYLCDYDRDGILDLLITDNEHYALYKGQPDGRFVDVTDQVGLPSKRGDLSPLGLLGAFVDLDGDGWEDLILGGRVYRNEAGKRFVDVTHATNLRFPFDATGVAIADFDRDGRIDLYVTRPGKGKADSWIDGKSGDAKGNQLWRNQGNWQFENVTARSGTSGDSRSTFAAVWLDANNDGWPDLYVTNEFGNGVLLVNNGDGTFRTHPLTDGPGDFGSMGVTCGDIDNDGHIDLYVPNMYSKAGNRVLGNLLPGTYPEDVMAKMRRFVAGSQLWHNRGKLQFEPLGQHYQVAGVGWAYGAALVDLDNDGWLDLYATCGFISQSRTEPDG